MINIDSPRNPLSRKIILNFFHCKYTVETRKTDVNYICIKRLFFIDMFKKKLLDYTVVGASEAHSQHADAVQ